MICLEASKYSDGARGNAFHGESDSALKEGKVVMKGITTKLGMLVGAIALATTFGATVATPAEAHCHHHHWNNGYYNNAAYGYGGNGYGVNPYAVNAYAMNAYANPYMNSGYYNNGYNNGYYNRGLLNGGGNLVRSMAYRLGL